MGLKENERNLTITVYRDDFPDNIKPSKAFGQLVNLFKEVAKSAPSTFIRLLDKYPLAETLIDAIDNHKGGNSK